MTRSSAPLHLWIPGRPTGAAGWRGEVAAAAAGLRVFDSLALQFVLRPGTWVDLDTLAESTAHGLRDAGVLQPAFRGLDGVLATKRFGEPTGVRLTPAPAATLHGRPPGPVALTVHHDAVPRPGNRAAKLAWRNALATAWGAQPVLSGDLWADVALAVPGSLFGPLEVVLDALEPVLGRDPRGRPWQTFFPNDDRIVHLSVRRASRGPAMTLRLGMLEPS